MTRTRMLKAVRLDEKILELNRIIDRLTCTTSNAVTSVQLKAHTQSGYSDVYIDDSMNIDLREYLLQLKNTLINSKQQFENEFEEL